MASSTHPPDRAPAVDQLLDSLGDSVRREVIRFFEHGTGRTTATVAELTDHVDRRLADADRKEVRIRLLQVHLPKLGSREWLDFDRRTGRVRYYGHEHAERWMRELAELLA